MHMGLKEEVPGFQQWLLLGIGIMIMFMFLVIRLRIFQLWYNKDAFCTYKKKQKRKYKALPFHVTCGVSVSLWVLCLWVDGKPGGPRSRRGHQLFMELDPVLGATDLPAVNTLKTTEAPKLEL